MRLNPTGFVMPRYGLIAHPSIHIHSGGGEHLSSHPSYTIHGVLQARPAVPGQASESIWDGCRSLQGIHDPNLFFKLCANLQGVVKTID